MRAAWLVLGLCLTGAFSLATVLEPRHQRWSRRGGESADALTVLFGEGRRLFANHFFAKADAYFHKGFYPSFLDERTLVEEDHMGKAARSPSALLSTNGPSEPGHVHEQGEAHEPGDGESHGSEDWGFLGPPLDWIDRFSRHFHPSRHVHGQDPTEAREVLPWLQVTTSLDPQNTEAYVLSAFWLRQRLGRVNEAETALREGWRNNPGSYEILFELGRLFQDQRRDPARARNVWELALRKWERRNAGLEKPDDYGRENILAHLATLERAEGNREAALGYLRALKALSPSPDAIQLQIDELNAPAIVPRAE